MQAPLTTHSSLSHLPLTHLSHTPLSHTSHDTRLFRGLSTPPVNSFSAAHALHFPLSSSVHRGMRAHVTPSQAPTATLPGPSRHAHTRDSHSSTNRHSPWSLVHARTGPTCEATGPLTVQRDVRTPLPPVVLLGIIWTSSTADPATEIKPLLEILERNVDLNVVYGIKDNSISRIAELRGIFCYYGE